MVKRIALTEVVPSKFNEIKICFSSSVEFHETHKL